MCKPDTVNTVSSVDLIIFDHQGVYTTESRTLKFNIPEPEISWVSESSSDVLQEFMLLRYPVDNSRHRFPKAGFRIKVFD